MTVADRIAAFRAALDEWLRGLYHGMITHPAYEKIEKEAEDTEDEFMLACFPDAFGIPAGLVLHCRAAPLPRRRV